MTVDTNIVFTFGFGHQCVCGRPLRNCFTLVAAGSRVDARARMYSRWGNKWAFDYPTTDDAGVDEHGLQFVGTNFDDLTRCPCGDAEVEKERGE